MSHIHKMNECLYIAEMVYVSLSCMFNRSSMVEHEGSPDPEMTHSSELTDYSDQANTSCLELREKSFSNIGGWSDDGNRFICFPLDDESFLPLNHINH